MIIIKICFLLLIIICAIFYILYIWNFSLVLLVTIIAIPIIMFFSLLIAKKKINVDFAVKSHTASKGEPFNVQLCITNNSFFPIGKAEAIIEYYNIFNTQINNIELHFPIQSNNSQKITFQLSSKFCGQLKIRCAYITIYDPLRIFKFKVGKNINENIAVLPEGHDIYGFVNQTNRINEESNIFSEFSSGDDPSEVFDLHEYIEGDRINRIHWKLSSKKDNFIVKDYSMPIDSPITIFLDISYSEFSEYTLPIYDTLIESFVSLSQFLLQNERIHTLIYYNQKQKQFNEISITDIDTLSAAINNLIFSFNDDFYFEMPRTYFSSCNKESGFASFTFITAVPDKNILSYIDDEIDSDVKNVILVVKNYDSTENISDNFASINIMPVVIGKISSSVRDIEL